MMVHMWSDKVVFITGAAGGIGAAVVRKLLDEGVKHVAILDIVEDVGIKLQNEMNEKHGANKTRFFKCDVTDDDQLLGAFNSTINENGYIDVVINNAGIMNDSLHTYKKEITVNLTALVSGTLKALELMRKDENGKGGTVINIASIAALCQTAAMPVYWATKSAVVQFSNCIGIEQYYFKTGVRVLTICFGATETPLIDVKNLGSYDAEIDMKLAASIRRHPIQSKESAAAGVIEVYKRGDSGSTWLVSCDEPAKDITATVKQAYALLSQYVFCNK